MAETATLQKQPKRLHWVILAAVSVLALFLFVHPDIVETANHSYLFLESVFSGRFLHFYEDVMAHNNDLYYINFAHYSVLVYAIFGVFELPVFIVCKLFGLAVSEPLLYFIGKLVSTGFFAACLPLVAKIAGELGLNGETRRWAMLFTALWPPAFFACLVMGQYDSLCLFFILLGFWYWLKGDLLRFSLWMGVGAACKFFPLLLVVPLLLLAEKRITRILLYGALSLWLTVPLTLLFYKRDGDMNFFNSLMADRLFTATLPAGAELPLVPLFFALLCFAAYLWNPGDNAARAKTGLWLCLAVFGMLFLFTSWHPQWLILLAPFVVLTTLSMKRRFPWFIADILLSAGMLLHVVFHYPYQLEANILNDGIIGLFSGLKTTGVEWYPSIVFYSGNLPEFVLAVPFALFAAALAAHVLFKLPGKNGTLATRLSRGGAALYEDKLPVMLWVVFGASMAVWLLPTLFTWLKCFAFI